MAPLRVELTVKNKSATVNSQRTQVWLVDQKIAVFYYPKNL